MTCNFPFKVKMKDTGHIVDVPCGRCTACRIARAREWAARVLHESYYHENSIFLTLTYDNQHLPVDCSVHKDELQRFFKRLRKDIEPLKIKYFACGEYGDINNRPHYHAIIFGMSLKNEDKEIIKENWPFGFSYFGTVTYDSARYVTDYVLKKYDKEKAKEVYGDKEIPFCLMSNGIGKKYCNEYSQELYDNLGFTINGVNMALPRYYKNKLKINSQEFVADAVKATKEKLERLQQKGIKHEERFVEEQRMRDYKDEVLKARIKTYKKGKL